MGKYFLILFYGNKIYVNAWTFLIWSGFVAFVVVLRREGFGAIFTFLAAFLI